jgi:hypothetical protein
MRCTWRGLALADHGDGIQRLRAQRGIGAGAGIGGGGGMGAGGGGERDRHGDRQVSGLHGGPLHWGWSPARVPVHGHYANGT